jgi:pimeloyl-ACP methyl ester carboxylesterase
MTDTMSVQRPDGERIEYRRTEGERPVLLVHGFASNADATWDSSGWLRALEDAGRGAILVDLRGHGSSSKPTNPQAYSASILAGDLIAVIDAEGLAVVDVVGYSMGSQVARQLAVTYPDRLSRLVLGGIGTAEPFEKAGVARLRAALQGEQLLSDPFVEGILAGAQELPEADRLALAACIEGMAATAVTGVVSTTTLVVAGELDPIAYGADQLAQSLGALYLSIPGRRHGNTLSARAFKQVALEFLE